MITETTEIGVGDSLRRDDMKSRPAPVKRRARVLWQILFGGRRMASRLHPKGRAQQIAARFNQLYRVDDAYAVCFGKVAE